MINNKKIISSFAGDIIDKSILLKFGVSDVPQHVTERIYAKIFNVYGDINNTKIMTKKYIANHRPIGNTSDQLKYELINNGTVTILDRFKVKVNLSKNEFIVPIQSMNINASISEFIVRINPALLSGGIWGLAKLTLKGPKNNQFVTLETFEPFQVAEFDLDEFISRRSNFDLDEWIELLITSLGYNPKIFDSFSKQLILLSRLIPFVEKNVNMMELGPKATGKTYLYRNLSYHSFVISGSDTSPAQLFVNLNTGQNGIIPSYDVVAFDEITSTKLDVRHNSRLIGLLKDYMEGGIASRGDNNISAPTSIVFLGNINIGKNGRPQIKDYIYNLPKVYHDTAFLDRIHGIIPGWEIPKIGLSNEHFANNYGIISDYLGEAFHQLRSEQFNSKFDINFIGNSTIRNENAVIKIFHGLMKILFVETSYSKNIANQILNFACMFRNNLIQQQHLLEPYEFPDTLISAYL